MSKNLLIHSVTDLVQRASAVSASAMQTSQKGFSSCTWPLGKKLVTSATLVVTGALLVVTMFASNYNSN